MLIVVTFYEEDNETSVIFTDAGLPWAALLSVSELPHPEQGHHLILFPILILTMVSLQISFNEQRGSNRAFPLPGRPTA